MDGSKPTSRDIQIGAFNTNAIVYDNTPWRPGRDIDLTEKQVEEDQRKLKNHLATRIMSNGVEVLVKEKNPDGKHEQRNFKLIHASSVASHHDSSIPSKQLLSSAVATFVSRQQISALFPLHQLMQHNYIIKTCMTTYTYLTTVVQNKRSAISTFETIVSVVTTESLTNLYDTDIMPELKPTKTKYTEMKTIHPSVSANLYTNIYPKIDKRIDNDENNFDVIQPSEVSNTPCTSSCSCSNTKTEVLKTKYTNIDLSASSDYGIKSTKHGISDLNLKPTNKESIDKKTQYGPYEYETNSPLAPTDKIVEKYTEVINDYSDEKDMSVEESELLTNEQAPIPIKHNKVNTKNPEKIRPDKPQKVNKNKFVVADLLKLGTLGIKGLSQLAPVIEKMTGGFIKRQDINNKTTSTTLSPAVKLTPYNVNKRVDSEFEAKHSSFPIYIPVDEMETSESQIVFTNATLHQNLAWAAEHKQPKARIVPPRIIHESPLVNGGIPISPGEIITTNSDVIVGKPAIGGPLTLATSGIKLHNPVIPPPIDSFMSANEQYFANEKPLRHHETKVDDSFDLRPPELPKIKSTSIKLLPRPPTYNMQNVPNDQYPYRMPSSVNDQLIIADQIKTSGTALGNHGRPAFLDYIPSLAKTVTKPIQHHNDFSPLAKDSKETEIADNSPSSSEVVNTRIKTEADYTISDNTELNKPFLVDIQPSRVANVLIPHGSSTALVFAGSSEPHKTGDYVDDPLPYPEPGYFGSFSIDAPQMTNVHNVAPNNNKQFKANPSFPTFLGYKPNLASHKEESLRNDLKFKWKDNIHTTDYSKIPHPTSNQETYIQLGPKITVYDPDVYHPTNSDFNKLNQVKEKLKDEKEIIDKEYENYLAVPPPPQSQKTQYNKDFYDNSKPYSQKPIVHTKPVQDMKVFLNIQHPAPEKLPPKVTSEIYFAAQMPNSKPTPTYTIHMPLGSTQHKYNQITTNNAHPTKTGSNTVPSPNSFSVISSPNFDNESKVSSANNNKNNIYTVTLNTATNVATNSDTEQVIGSSIPVPVGTTTSVSQLNTDIPIGTNYALRVEDNNTPMDSYNLKDYQNPSASDEHNHAPQVPVTVEDNRWNKSSTDKLEATVIGHSNYKHNGKKEVKDTVNPFGLPSLNSHANFPMINEYNTPAKINQDVKPITGYVSDIKLPDTKRPGKLIPSIATNSHGWYSSVINENNINNINVEATTRKIIPLIHNEQDNIQFGQKVSSVGKPPTEFWAHKSPTYLNFNIGKPFTKSKPTEKVQSTIPSFTKKPLNTNYIPSIFGATKQPAYDIPIHDNSDETTSVNSINKATTETVKLVYENSEEIYDGEEESEIPGDMDGEVSSESMKIPVLSSSSETDINHKVSTEFTLLQEEVFESPKIPQKDGNKQIIDFNPGTQTEKPFKISNNTIFTSNKVNPVYGNNPYNPMKPRPFTTSTALVLDHQLQQPHWQINQMMENVTSISYEDNLELNIGEEMNMPATAVPTSTPKSYSNQFDNNNKKTPKPGFSTHPNTALIHNESIITSVVHIQDKKPLIVEKATEKTILPSFTLPNLEINRTSSEIIDLSPPPPTLDYNFKPSTNNEMIMGMSPPPRTPPGVRLPTRVPLTPRPVMPVRTQSPYRTKQPRPQLSRVTTQRPIRKPITRDEVSTYRPAYDILNSIRRPIYNRDQPSSQLMPPPRDIPSRITNPKSELPAPAVSLPGTPNIVFPTPISSGWLTSSGLEFSSSFNFAPTSIQFPETPKPSRISSSDEISSSENSYSYEIEASSEHIDEINSDELDTEHSSVSKTSSTESATTSTSKVISMKQNDSIVALESTDEKVTTDKIKVVPIVNKDRIRKPYPVRNDQKKSTTSKYKLLPKPTSIIRPTRTLSRPEILYPTRHTSIKKIVRPVSSLSDVIPSNVIESSESTVEEEFIQSTEVLKENIITTISPIEISSLMDKPFITITSSTEENSVIEVLPTHHAGNEIKIVDDIIPTKTEFRTTVITLTKTLSEPPKTVSSIGYVNLTHTLTVTHTETSLVSQSEGAVTETMIVTNTHTSTIVDVVTEIYTHVQPTTIIETVTKHIPLPEVKPTSVQEIIPKTKVPLDDISMSSEEKDNLIIKDETTDKIIQKIDNENEGDNDTFFVVMNKSQNGGQAPPVNTDIETGDYDGVTRNEQVNSNGESQVLFGEILLAGAPFLETTNVNANGIAYGKECQPDCKASRNERCQRIDGIMKCVCRPGFARMFPDRPCKPTYTYSVKLALGSQGKDRLEFHDKLADNSSKEYNALAMATHEGINRMVMQSDLRDVFHGIHITGFHPVEIKDSSGELYEGVMNDFYVQLSDNAHESRLKEVIEKYLRNNNYSLGGTKVHAASGLVDRLNVSDFDECVSVQFHDCSEHAQCFNLRGTYTCSCLEGYADLSVNTLYPGRICSAEPVGCERCNYHGACYSRDDRRVLCECFQWYAGGSCQINLKVVLISLVVCGALLSVIFVVCAVLACSKRRPPQQQRSIVACIQGMPSLHQGTMPKQRADRRALISERGESGDASSVHNASLPYIPANKRSSGGKKLVISDPPAHDPPPPPPAQAVMIPRARLHPHHGDSRENIARKKSLELSSEAKLISYLESGAATTNDEMRRKHSLESSYSANKDRHVKQGALVSAGFKVSTTVRPDEDNMNEDRDDLSSVNKGDLEADLSRFDTLRKSYSQEDMSEWTDAERRLGELTLSEARSVGGTLPASTGRAASSTRLTHQEANTMAERDLGSTFLLPHVHLYKPDLTSDVSEFDSL